MLNKDQTHSIFDRVSKYSQADETEVLIHGGRSALTRFANNTIHQNVAEEGYVVSIRAALDGKYDASRAALRNGIARPWA